MVRANKAAAATRNVEGSDAPNTSVGSAEVVRFRRTPVPLLSSCFAKKLLGNGNAQYDGSMGSHAERPSGIGGGD